MITLALLICYKIFPVNHILIILVLLRSSKDLQMSSKKANNDILFSHSILILYKTKVHTKSFKEIFKYIRSAYNYILNFGVDILFISKVEYMLRFILEDQSSELVGYFSS